MSSQTFAPGPKWGLISPHTASCLGEKKGREKGREGDRRERKGRR